MREGAVNLSILAFGQQPQCLEPIAAGAFRHMGRSMPPSLVSIAANILRVMAAWLLAKRRMPRQQPKNSS